MTYDDLSAQATVEVGNGHWKEAMALYDKALKLAEAAKNVKQITDAKHYLLYCRYQIAAAFWTAKKWDEAIEAAEKVAQDGPDDLLAPKAMVLALASAASKYDALPDAEKEQAYPTLKRLSDAIIERYPQLGEALDAKFIQGRVLLAKGELAAGLAILEKLPASAKQYSAAQQLVGQTYMKMFQDEMKKAPADRDEKVVADLRAKTVGFLQKSLELQRKALAPGAPLPKELTDVQRYLGGLALEAKDAKQALALLEPLLADWEKKTKDPKEEMDKGTQNLLVNSIRAYIEVGEQAKAGKLVEKLVQVGPDTAAINGALVEFTKLLDADRKQAKAALDEAQGAEAKINARKRENAASDLFRNTLSRLLKRKEHSIGGLIYLADAASAIGMTTDAGEVYGLILKRAESDPDFRQKADKYIASVRAKRIGLLRNEHQFDKAVTALDDLIKQDPKDVGPYLEKARTLQAWAEEEPKIYSRATAGWTVARELLGRLKPKPPEYYDAIYNVATCLMGEFKDSKNKDKALQAEQVLRSTLIISPTLTSKEPDEASKALVEKYNVLLSKALAAQEKPPASAP